MFNRVGVLLVLISGVRSAFGAQTGPNVIPINIDGSFGSQNVPFVSLTICEPGTNNCQRVTGIELDTGSSGLRLFSSVLHLNLPQEQHSSAGVAECVQFGGGDVLWGPVRLADVVLGEEKASGVPIQVADAAYSGRPDSCGSHPDSDPAAFGANGILGISPATTDCDGETCPGTTPGKLYYSCERGTCSDLSPAVAEQVGNPAAALPEDNNGVVVSFPPVASPGGVASVSGSLILGIGTQTNNRPSSSTRAYPSDPDGIFKARFEGKEYWSKFDTGTSFWTLPVNQGIPKCGASEDGFLCPRADIGLSFTVVGVDGSESAPVSFSIGNAQDLLSSSNVAFDDVAWDNILPGNFMAAMPFFFGREIYIGFQGRASPMGAGPYYGF